MSLWIQLDRSHAHFTNLDFVTGKVVLYLKYETAVSAISVKLEGESRTRLAGPRSYQGDIEDDRKRTEYEEHKVRHVSVVILNQDSIPKSSIDSLQGIHAVPNTRNAPSNGRRLNQLSGTWPT